MKKLLLVAYYYPPHPGIAAVRPGALSRYLIDYGWDVSVVTAEYPGRMAGQYQWPVIEVADPGILSAYQRRRKSRNVVSSAKAATSAKSQSDSPKRSGIRKWAFEFFYYPDRQRNWAKPCLQACESLGAFDVVLTTSSPATSHLIGAILKHEGVAQRWVADFRDLWTQNHFRQGQFSPFRESLERRLEQRTLEEADLLVTVSEPMAERLRQLHRNAPVAVATNGYEEQPPPQDVIHHPQFTLVYTGQLYTGRRDPTLLLQTLRNLMDKNQVAEGEVMVRFVGEDSAWLRDMVRSYNLEHQVAIEERIPREEARREQHSATVLLLINWDHPAEAGTYTGKLFEYLEARRPILAIGGPSGVVSELLERTQAGFHVRSGDDLEKILLNWLDEYRTHQRIRYQGIESEIHEYSWRRRAGQYAALLDELV